MKRNIGLVLVVAALASLPAFAQQKTQAPAAKAVLEYVQNSSGDMLVKQADGKELTGKALDIGLELPPGCTIVTFEGDSAEVRLEPNGSIIRIAANTNFQIEGIQGVGGADISRFAVAVGKIRNVAGKATGNERYAIRGASTVCGVRGTDWAFHVLPGQIERAFTFSGLIDFTNAAGQTIEIAAGKYADALSGAAFQALEITKDLLGELMRELEFVKLKPDDVPGHAEKPAEPAPKTAEQPPPAATTPPPAEPEAKKPAEPAKEEPAAEPKPESKVMAWLRQVLGMEIGSLTIGDTVYSKAVLQPTFSLGKLKLSLYLPVIYQSNMFDPEDWYHPAGNDEWSFGTDQEGADQVEKIVNIVKDATSDLLLKIRYVEFGQQRDPFFIKVGNLDDITVGSGFIMRDFANDSEFPSVRRVGLNIGVDAKSLGFELMANDLATLPPEIFGGRFYVKPFGKLAVGLAAVADINPSGTLMSPAFFHAGLNLDLPVVRSDFLSLIFFADVASSLPYFGADYTDPVTGEFVRAGFHTEALWDPEAGDGVAKLKNWGFAAGVQGNILIATYRLEYRYFTGSFRPAYFDGGYERERPRRVSEVVSYLNHMNDPGYVNLVMGIYGEAGFSLLKDKLSFTAGYMWPWAPGLDLAATPTEDWPEDFLTLRFSVAKGVIPVLGLSGALIYERSGFASTLAGDGTLSEKLAALFDARSVAKVEVLYPVAPIMDLALTITGTVRYDAEGDMVLVPGTALPRLDPSVSVEMRMHL